MKAVLVTKRFIRCPHGCAHEFSVEHLFEGSHRHAGPWFCDECGRGWEFHTSEDGMKITESKVRMRFHKVLLELPPQKESVFFTLASGEQRRPGETKDPDSIRFLYEEHQCPTNWMRKVEGLKIGTDTDPHGLFKFVSVFEAES